MTFVYVSVLRERVIKRERARAHLSCSARTAAVSTCVKVTATFGRSGPTLVPLSKRTLCPAWIRSRATSAAEEQVGVHSQKPVSSLHQVTAYRLFRISACTALEGVLVERTEFCCKERANADCHRRHRHLRIIPWFGLPISEGFSRTERATVRIVLTHAHRGLVQEKFRVEKNFSVQVTTPHASASHAECS